MAWQLLVSSDFGLFSLVTILLVIAIGVGFWWFFRSRIAEEDEQGGRKGG